MERKKKRFCYKYPHPAVAADCVIFGSDGTDWNVLLIERGGEPFKGRWAFPGGFMNMEETAGEAAARELQEETGIEGICLEQLGAFSAVHRDPRERVVSIVFLGWVHCADYRPAGGDDAVRAQWHPLRKLPPLAFDHPEILKAALRRLREKIILEPELFTGKGIAFSQTELDNLLKMMNEI